MIKSPAYILLLLACFFLHYKGNTQHIKKGPKFTHIKENALLSNQVVTTIYQDSKGWLWVGTLDGLNRFDGYEFKVYRNVDGDTLSLLKNYVRTIFEDHNGTLWVSTLNSGLQYYNRELDVFNRVPEFSRNHCQIMVITEDFNRNVWISGVIDSKAFVATLDEKTGNWKSRYLFTASEGIYAMIQDSEDEFWLGSRLNGLYKWNVKTNALKQYLHDPLNPKSIPGDYIEDIVRDEQGNLWIATRHAGLCKYQREEDNFKRFTAQDSKYKISIIKNDIMDLCLDNQYVWIAIENGGLSRIDTRSEKIENFPYDHEDPTSIINNSIWSLHKDRQGRLWVGSYAKGLCVLDPHEKKFYNIEIDLRNDLVNAVIKDSKDRVWIGSEDGLVRIENNILKHFRHDPLDSKSLSADPVQCVFEDSQHRIWVGTWNGGINRYDESTEQFIRYTPDPKKAGTLKDPNVFTISESKKTGELLVCTFGGLHILKDEAAGIFENIRDNPREGDLLLLSIHEDHMGKTWVGSYSGLSLYDLETKKARRIDFAGNPDQVGDRVNYIFQDRQKSLWLATSAGLFQMISPEKFIRYTTKDGLPVNTITGIVEDSRGNLWLGTTHGLVLFNPEYKTFRTYNVQDGLNSTAIRERSISQDKDGLIYFGSNGVNVFHPDSIYSNVNEPPVYMTDLKIFNQSIKPKSPDGILEHDISETKEITLDYEQATISIHYVGLNYTASIKNQYAYKLEGFDPDWNYVGQLRFATYTSLDPGTYTFRVKASNNDGLWNAQGTSLVIHILPPWWGTWWFRSLIIASLISGFVLIFYIRTRNIRRINRIQEEIINHRTKQLQDTNNALVIREEEIELQNKKLKEQAEELSAINEELVQNQEEVSSQRDLVYMQNLRLMETQKIIELQKESLEVEVAKRTKELVEYNHQLEQFAFISAHNLRSPVARILGLGHLLGRPENEIQDKEQIYPKLVHAAEELDSVVKDLNTILDLKKNNDLYISPIDLRTEVNIIIENLEHEITLTETVITTDFSALATIRTVKPYMDSILYNLISNAIKYRHPDRRPKIHIKTDLFENEYSISVVDNGLGIDTSLFQEKIFTLYSRFHTHIEGKGMGLYLVKTQITALGGRIEIESQVDRGTTFRAYFKLT